MTSIRSNALRCSLAALALLALAQPASAQSTRRLAAGLDAAIGTAPGRGGEFRDRDLLSMRFGMTLAYPLVARTSLVVGGDIEQARWLFDRTDECRPRSDGGCMGNFPDVKGWSAAVGLRVTPFSRVELQALAGRGRYRTEMGENERAIQYSSARVLHGDVAVKITSGLWMTVTGRELQLLDPIGGARLSLRPLTVGVRLSSR